MITIAELPSLGEAYVLKSLLEVQNINSFIPDEKMGGNVVELVPSVVGTCVQVDEKDVERALKIVQGFPNARIRHPQPQ